MFWPWEIIERDHEIQNPTTPEKIRLLGDYLHLTDQSHVLDVACGKGGPTAILAATYGCRVTGVEIRPEFAQEARSRAVAAGLDSLIEIETADASELQLDSEQYAAALCLGATFVCGTIAEAAAALRSAVPSRGFVAIGEPFWRQWPLPAGIDDEGYTGLHETVTRLEQAGFELTGIIASSDDDWDHYESQHWRAINEWLGEHPQHPGAEDVRVAHDRFRRDYLRYKRALLGWAIFVGRRV